MAGEAHAARLHDPVAHSHALTGFLAGAAVGFLATLEAAAVIGAIVGAVALEVGTAGLATPLVIGVGATVAEVGLTMAAGGLITGAAEQEGEKLGSESLGDPTGAVAQGSPNVLINGMPAARATDQETCHSGKIAQGSRTVGINGLAAARVGDKTTCGAVISQGSPDVVIGGPTGTFLGIQSEVPSWVRWAVVIGTIAVSLGSAARELGPMLAEINETGLARALQSGAKALKTSLEEKGSGGTSSKFNPGVEDAAQRMGLDPKTLQDVVDTPKPNRTDPASYLPASRLSEHADAFAGGGSRFTLQSSVDKYGLGQRDGTSFITTPSQADAIVSSANGDPRLLEQALGLPTGQLDESKLLRVDFNPEAMQSLNMRMPSGNEAGANDQWIPGGYLPSGANEAVIDSANASPQHYSIISIGH